MLWRVTRTGPSIEGTHRPLARVALPSTKASNQPTRKLAVRRQLRQHAYLGVGGACSGARADELTSGVCGMFCSFAAECVHPETHVFVLQWTQRYTEQKAESRIVHLRVRHRRLYRLADHRGLPARDARQAQGRPAAAGVVPRRPGRGKRWDA